MSRALCLKAQHAIFSFRLSWAPVRSAFDSEWKGADLSIPTPFCDRIRAGRFQALLARQISVPWAFLTHLTGPRFATRDSSPRIPAERPQQFRFQRLPSAGRPRNRNLRWGVRLLDRIRDAGSIDRLKHERFPRNQRDSADFNSAFDMLLTFDLAEIKILLTPAWPVQLRS
jgi:hypothetical protein